MDQSSPEVPSNQVGPISCAGKLGVRLQDSATVHGGNVRYTARQFQLTIAHAHCTWKLGLRKSPDTNAFTFSLCARQDRKSLILRERPRSKTGCSRATCSCWLCSTPCLRCTNNSEGAAGHVSLLQNF